MTGRPLRRVTPLLLLALFLPAPPGRAAPEFGLVSTVPMPAGQILEAAALADFDGDGKRDLVVSTYVGGHVFDRWLHVYLRREGPVSFGGKPDRSIPLTPDVVAFCPGDVDPSPGAEIVLYTATGAFVWRTAAGEQELPARLASSDFLWQLPHPREVFCFEDGVRDVDGDGLADLLLPQAGGYRICFQDRARQDGAAHSSFARSAFLSIPDYRVVAGRESFAAAREKLKSLRTSLAIGGDEDEDFLSVRNSAPFPVFRDFDGDGRADLLAETSSELLVWRQTGPGKFAKEPDVRLTLPLEVDTGRRLDFSFSAHARDLDGDGRCDYVIVAGDRHSEDVRTQILVYTRAGGGKDGLFGEKGVPQQALFIGGFAALLDLADVDGNGRPDMVVGSVRVDALDAIRAATNGNLDAELFVYLNEGGRFSRRPDFKLTIPIPSRNVQQAGRAITARFLGDLAGTGVSDLLLRDDPERLRLLAVRRTGRDLAAFPQPLFETRISRNAVVKVEDSGGPPELLVLEDRKVLHVRFAK